jgi:polar amino acid transport system permease protein
MASDKIPEPTTQTSEAEKTARRHGRTGLAIPWEHIPWWGIIILIVGVVVGYSMLTNVRYLDAMYFIFDLPWNKRILARETVGDNGEWTIDVQTPLDTGNYTVYVEYLDEADEVIQRSGTFQLRVPSDAPEEEMEPIPLPSPESTLQLSTRLPAVTGKGPPGSLAMLVDDFSDKPLRVLRRILLAKGVFLTLRVTILSFSGALIMGLIFGLMRVSSRSPNLFINAGWRLGAGLALFILLLLVLPSWRRFSAALPILIIIEIMAFILPAMPYTISTLYVEVIRGIPMLVIVLYMGFAITPAFRELSSNWPTGEIDLRGLPAAIIGLAFGYGAYLAEVYRAGIESIPRGQMEAARSLGMSYFEAMRHVILPQAIRVILPPLGNDFIAMLKDSSLISVIALPEILQQGRLWISRNFRAFEGYNTVAMLYLVMTLMLSLMVRYIERRTAIE